MSATESLERKVTVSLPWLDINAETDKQLKQAQRRVRIDGFRPGKAPLKMVASMYGASIQNDAINDLAQAAFNKIAQEQNLRIAAVTGIEPVENQDTSGTDLQLTFVYETYPDIQLADFSALEIEKVVSEVGEAEVDSTIEILRKQRTMYKRVEREAKEGDRVIIDFEGKIDGVPFDGGSAKNYPFVLGQGQMLPEFEKGISGMKEDESKDVEVSFPEDYHGKDVAGKTAVFTITVHNVAEATLPEVDEVFARALGIADGDVAKMRAEVQKNVAREVKRRLNAQNTDAVMKALRSAHTFPLPQAFVKDEAHRLSEEMKQNLVKQGLDANDLQLPAEMFNERAQERVALGLLLPEIVEKHNLKATEEQIKNIITEFADSYEDPQEVIDWYFADSSRLAGVSNMAVESNVVDFVLGKAKVTEKKLSFDEVMGAGA